MDLDTALERIESDVYDLEAHNAALQELLELEEHESLLGLLTQSYTNVHIDHKFVEIPDSADDKSVDEIKQLFASNLPTTVNWHIKHLELLSLVGDTVGLVNAFKRLHSWHYRPKGTRQLWEVVSQHFTVLLAQDAASASEPIKQAYLFVLGLPHFQHELTYSEYKNFLFNTFNETAPKNPSYTAAVKLMQKIEHDGGAQIVSQRFNNNQNDAKLVLGCMLEGLEADGFGPRGCQQLLDYLGHVDLRKLKLFKSVNLRQAMQEVSHISVRVNPRDGKCWFNAALVNVATDISAVLQAPVYSAPTEDVYTQWTWLAKAKLLHLSGSEEDDLFVEDCLSKASQSQTDDASLEKAILGYYMRTGKTADIIRGIFKQLSRSKASSLTFWKFWIEWERRYPKDTNSIQQVYQQALKHTGSGVVESYQDFLNGEGTTVPNLASNYFNAGFFADDHEDQPLQPMEDDSVEQPEANSHSATATEPARDREHLTVILANLPETTTEQVSTFFADCGALRNVFLNLPYAVVEFSSHEEKLAALTRDHKKLGGQEIRVTDGHHTTVYVTNFAADDTEETLREQFGVFGEIASLRLPSLSINKHRRFCYIQFTTSAAADLAVQFGIDSNSGIVVEISDPSRAKKAKQGKKEANPESTVYISRLDYDTSSEEIEAAFGEFGTVTNLTIPNKGQDLGTKKNIGFAFLTFETVEAAQASLVLNGSHILGKDIQVSIADKPRRKRPQNDPRDAKERFVPRKRKVLGGPRDVRGTQSATAPSVPNSEAHAKEAPQAPGTAAAAAAPKSNDDFRSFLR